MSAYENSLLECERNTSGRQKRVLPLVSEGIPRHHVSPGDKGDPGAAPATSSQRARVPYILEPSGEERVQRRRNIFETKTTLCQKRIWKRRVRFPQFTLFNIYFPNGKKNKERLQYKLDFYDEFLSYADNLKAQKHHIIVCGDFNTAHKEIDLARPKENEHISGFLPVERAWIDTFIGHGYVDTFRTFHTEPNHYSWWDLKTGARARNVGWRIDYFFVDKQFLPNIKNTFISQQVQGSDHCPVGIEIKP
jgi:exodeoxyribonuclease III